VSAVEIIPMSLGTFRGIMTGILLLLFLMLIGWAWSRRRRESFDAAARLPLEEEDPAP